LTWADLGADLVISKVTTKTGAVVSNDLKLCPLTLGLLQKFLLTIGLVLSSLTKIVDAIRCARVRKGMAFCGA
jgi:hypothetical protein